MAKFKFKPGSSLERKVQQDWGLEPIEDRGTILPLPMDDAESWLDPEAWVAPQWLYDMAKSVSLPSHAIAGGDYSMQDVGDFSLDLGLAGLAGGAAVGPDDALGMFVGRRAIGSRPGGKFDIDYADDALADARFEEGLHGLVQLPLDANKDLFERTLYFTGPEGQLRREISDVGAHLDPKAFSISSTGGVGQIKKGQTVADVVSHPDLLLREYPELANLSISGGFSNRLDAARGGFSAGSDRIEAMARDPDDLLSVILHELQHGIQSHEGWGRGADPDKFKEEYITAQIEKLMAQNAIDKMRLDTNLDLKDLRPDFRAALENQQARLEAANRVLAKGDPYSRYYNVAGEAEARDTQARRHMSELDRILNLPALLGDQLNLEVVMPPGPYDLPRSPVRR